MKRTLTAAFSSAAVFTFCLAASAADWPNFRGPNHNGISSETGWAAKWPDAGPKQLWKANVGIGFSSVTVANGRAYATGNAADVSTVYCFDAETGSTLWKFAYDCPLFPLYNPGGTSSSPTIEGNRVYTLSKEGPLFCLDADKGTVIWSNNLAEVTGAAKPKWGFSSSPLIQDNLLLLDLGGAGTAVDKATGKVVWTSTKDPAGYSTPVPCTFNGTAAVAILSADTAYAVETKTGKQIWSYPFKTQDLLNCADVIVSGNDFFVSAAYNHGGSMAHFDGTNTTEVWANKLFRNHVNASVLVDGFLYGVDGSVNGQPATLKCVEFATGKENWKFPGLGGGGLIVADHKIIMLSDKGELVVGEVTKDAFTPISRAQVVGGKCWTAPTLANGRIYCRSGNGDVACVDVKGGAATP